MLLDGELLHKYGPGVEAEVADVGIGREAETGGREGGMVTGLPGLVWVGGPNAYYAETRLRWWASMGCTLPKHDNKRHRGEDSALNKGVDTAGKGVFFFLSVFCHGA